MEMAMPTTAENAHRPLLARLSAWWRGWREREAHAGDLCACGQEVEQIARDIGISVTELHALARQGPDASNLLHQRLAALKIDEKVLSRTQPEVMRDLERVCSLCDTKRQCKHDMASNPADPGWQEYCPNAQTLAALKR